MVLSDVVSTVILYFPTHVVADATTRSHTNTASEGPPRLEPCRAKLDT